MLYSLLIVVHIFVCFILILVILIQGGRGGMSEAFGGGAAQSLFGGRVATVMTKLTAGCAVMFMVTCLSLAYLSSMRGRSVIDQIPEVTPESIPPMLPAMPSPSSIARPEPSKAVPETKIPNNTPTPGGPSSSH